MAAPMIRLAHEPADWRRPPMAPYDWNGREKLTQVLALVAVGWLIRKAVR